jgi:hypothetical protein
MTINLQSDAPISALIGDTWTPLQIDACMYVATAKIVAFEDQAHRLGEMVRLNLLSRRDAADALQAIAVYNSLPFEYGQDRVQTIIAEGLRAK